MDIIILPASGRHFPRQIGVICDLCESGYKPDVTMGTSGGNLAGYLTAAADWEKNGVLRMCETLNSDLYCKSWFNKNFDFIPSWVAGFFKGSMYDNSSRNIKYFNTFFNKVTVQKYEIWTGVYNTDCKKSQLFCNRSSNNTTLKYRGHYPDERCLRPVYLSGDVNNISKTCIASATIPGFIPRQKILGKTYLDGGISYTSPGGMMKRTFKHLKKFHITYVNSFNINEDSKMDDCKNLYKEIINGIEEGEIHLSIHDRRNVIELLGKKFYYKEFKNCNIEMMKRLQFLRKNTKKSLIEYYPFSKEQISITSHRSTQIISIVNNSRKKCGARVWWVGDKNCFDTIC